MPVTMTASPEPAFACSEDLAAVRELLRNAGLPFEDLHAGMMQDFIVLRDAEGRMVAAGGIERHGNVGLLRSVVVHESARGRGLGCMMTGMLEAHARTHGIKALYLLTTTAADFFPRLGYEKFAREQVPVEIAQSAEFASLCPASATCMRKVLA